MFRSSVARWLVVASLVTMGSFADLSATHAWGPYHWARQSNPVTLKLGNNLPSWWHSYLLVASDEWSISGVLDTTVVPGLSNSATCPSTSGRVEVCAAFYGNTGWLGIATIYLNAQDHIVAGTVQNNDTYFHTAQYNTPEWRQFVMCQEVGHTFGLDHQDETFNNPNLGTCMDYTDDPDGTINGQLSNVSPNHHDYEQLELIYHHLDNTTTVGSSTATRRMPPAMFDIHFATRAQWGKRVSTSDDGRSAVFELDFGNGNRVRTFVIFA